MKKIESSLNTIVLKIKLLLVSIDAELFSYLFSYLLCGVYNQYSSRILQTLLMTNTGKKSSHRKTKFFYIAFRWCWHRSQRKLTCSA